MLKKVHISVIVGVATAIWAVVLRVRGLPVTVSELGSFSLVVSGTFLACWAFDRYVWPCRVRGWCVFHGWLVACPDIRGTWEVNLQSSWVDPTTGKGIAPIRCFYGVRQTSSSLQMHLMTPESESWLQTHRFLPSAKTDGYSLIGVYTNQPSAFLRGVRSEIHHGTIVLDFHGADPSRPDSFNGEYWTDRGTKGTMSARRIASGVISRYADGLALASTTSAAGAPAQ